MLLEHCWRTLIYLLTFWVEVACAALYLINKLPSPNWVMCPHFKKKKINVRPNYSMLYVCGCVVRASCHPSEHNKLSSQAAMCFGGLYSLIHKGFHS